MVSTRKVKPKVKCAKALMKKAIMKPRKIEVIHVLEAEDMLISELRLPTPCPIKVEIGTKKVSLQIGPRDMQWAKTRKGWEHISSGTMVAPDFPREQHEETVEEIDANSTEDNAGSPNEKGEY